MDSIPRDPIVLEELKDLVRFKHGKNVDENFVEQESTRLYDVFSNQLISYFEPMLSEEQKQEFDDLAGQEGTDQEGLLNFLVGAIPDLQNQVMQALKEFEANYIRK